MDLGRQRTYPGIWTLPIEGHVVAKRSFFYSGQQDNTPHGLGRLCRPGETKFSHGIRGRWLKIKILRKRSEGSNDRKRSKI